MKLPRSFYQRPTLEVARDLIGKRLVRVLPTRDQRPETRDLRSGIIVETEAYIGAEDLACHAARGRTARTEVMFQAGGVAYIYLIYGVYNCLNLVTEGEGFPAAVLIRALEPEPPLEGGTNGPGKLCRALAIVRSLNGDPLDGDVLFVEDSGEAAPPVAISARIGVDYAGEWSQRPWRFYIPGSRWVSRAVSGRR